MANSRGKTLSASLPHQVLTEQFHPGMTAVPVVGRVAVQVFSDLAFVPVELEERHYPSPVSRNRSGLNRLRLGSN